MRVEMVKSTELLTFFRIRKVNIWHDLLEPCERCLLNLDPFSSSQSFNAVFVGEIFAVSKEGSKALDYVANEILQFAFRSQKLSLELVLLRLSKGSPLFAAKVSLSVRPFICNNKSTSFMVETKIS